MEREQRKELESNDTKRYLFLQAALAILSFVTILVGSLYFEKYQEEWITSLIVTLLLGLVYGNVLKEYLDNWKIILGIHFIMMLLITIGFLFDGFYKPIAFAPIVIGSFLTPEVGLAAAVYYGITAVLYTMETGEILMLYLLVAGVGIYFLRDFFSSNLVGKKIGAILVLFLLQAAGTILFRFYMYREAEWSIAMISGGLLAGVTGVFSFLLPLFASMETITFQKTEKEKKKVENSFGKSIKKGALKKERKKKTGQSLLLDENSELFGQLKANQELYQHSFTVARIAEGVATSIDADRALVKAGAMYHDIGKLVNGEDYITEGVSLCREHHILDRVIRLIEEHNVNYKIPTSKEAAIVMLADTIVSTMEFNQKKGKETDPELLVEKIFKIRKEKGTLKTSGITEIELELMEEAMKKEVGVL